MAHNEESAKELLIELYTKKLNESGSEYAKGIRDALESVLDSNIQLINDESMTVLKIQKKLIEDGVI